MGAKTQLTFEQFEQLPDDGLQHQLLRGEHIACPPATARRSSIRHKLHNLLRPFTEKHQSGEIYIAAGFKLAFDTWLQPDSSFLRTAHVQRTGPDEYFEGAPALAIEVVSDSNTASQLDSKMEEYFAHGSEEVWIVFPKTKKIRVHNPDGTATTATTEVQSALFPGLPIPLSTLFQD